LAIKHSGKELSSRTQEQTDNNQLLQEILIGTVGKMGPKWDVHLPLFLTAPALARILWLDHVYQRGLNVQGSIVEFGSQWGASYNIFNLLKIIHEPWNASRQIFSFSIFEEGFIEVSEQDGTKAQLGDYGTSAGWHNELEKIIKIHTDNSGIASCKQYEIVPGDAVQNLEKWLSEHPHTIFSHVHFDLDVYKPTKEILELIIDRIPIGGIIIFDELNCEAFPGETVAVNEVLGIKNLKLVKTQYQPYSSYAIRT
jgi:hypothetical protein